MNKKPSTYKSLKIDAETYRRLKIQAAETGQSLIKLLEEYSKANAKPVKQV